VRVEGAQKDAVWARGKGKRENRLSKAKSILLLFRARAGSTVYIFFFYINRVRGLKLYNTVLENLYENIL
jgi:hypothetical protein